MNNEDYIVYLDDFIDYIFHHDQKLFTLEGSTTSDH